MHKGSANDGGSSGGFLPYIKLPFKDVVGYQIHVNEHRLPPVGRC